ncbi:MAG TPA: biotin/lipoyl-containing protein, partial [Rubrobacteraceae bacterium]|nr:biotin/lipoyl-containing protein [Rubrobacteraceae bacterium]
MAVELKVPSLGMDMEEANILRWLVEEGAKVEKGQPVLEIDTDKTSFEIESPADGIIRGIHGAEGETMPVGAT